LDLETYKIQITGRVQGVGFRPFIYNLAVKNQLVGSVSNNANGVIIFITTSKVKANVFLNSIVKELPKVAIIENHTIEKVSIKKFENFKIIPSKTGLQIQIPITPDFAICDKCIKEINSPTNRRNNYAFTTCIHCGPRYAITKKYPFERQNTTLRNFKMCKNCKAEYKNPSDRRFHSQTNSCLDCGITMELTENSGKICVVSQNQIIDKLVELLHAGNIIALKSTNGYLLCCDANNIIAVSNLRKRKQRYNKPFAVLYPSLKQVKLEFNLSEKEKMDLQSIIRPIVILENTNRFTLNADYIAPNLNQTGVMLPSSTLLQLILQKINKPIIATSGNAHGSPINTTKKEAIQNLTTIADYFLHHNLKIEFPQDDSVIKYVNETKIIIRRSRGLSPNYLNTENLEETKILAMGAHLKSTFTFLPNQHIYVSQYFGNLNNYDVINRFKVTIQKYISLFNTNPKTILIDKHPQYQSSILGKELLKKNTKNVIEIQHHKAHFCSVLAENNLFKINKKVLGVIWDGTGLGDDYKIWGGEFFTYQNRKMERINHFDYFNWLANDKMAKEPRLSLFSLLSNEDRKCIKSKFSKTEFKIYCKLSKNNTLKTASVGRLFDAVASLLNIIDVNTYDAEAPMLLENIAKKCDSNKPIDLLEKENYDKIPSQLIVKKILKLKQKKYTKEHLANSFIYTLALLIIREAKKNNIEIIACSGGVFQNLVLLDYLFQLTSENKIELKINRKLPANDENISFGQLMYYQNIKN